MYVYMCIGAFIYIHMYVTVPRSFQSAERVRVQPKGKSFAIHTVSSYIYVHNLYIYLYTYSCYIYKDIYRTTSHSAEFPKCPKPASSFSRREDQRLHLLAYMHLYAHIYMYIYIYIYVYL